MNNMQKVLVTGANGFIGSHLVDRLISEDVSVRCLVRKTSNLQWLNHPKLELAYGELNDSSSLEKAASDVDVVFHLGGRTKAATRDEYFQANASGTVNLLQAVLKQSKNLKRFVYVSTQAAAGPSRDGNPVRESDIPHPVTAYGKSKLAGEQAVLEASSRLPVTIVRAPSVFGPRDKDMFNLFKIIHSGIRPRLGWRPRLLSILFVEDLIEGLMLAAQKMEALAQVYFLNTEDSVSWHSLNATIAQTSGKKTIPVIVPVSAFLFFVYVNDAICGLLGKQTIMNRSKIPEFLPRYWIADGSKARRELGFVSKYGLNLSVQKTMDWYKNNGWF